MYLHTMNEPKNAAQIMVRLTEVEKIRIRGASDGALEHMRQSMTSDGPPSIETMAEIKAALDAKFGTYDQRGMVPSTWQF